MPIMNIAVILLVLGLGYFWAGQGLFSALIHFVCVLIAGAVSFAVWEPLTYAVLLGVREDIAWTVGLLGPFVVTLALLRVLTNKYVSSNLFFDDTTNFVGGAAFGAMSGLLTAGMLIISIGFLRLPSNFMGYQAVNWDRATGAVDARSGSNLWVPADMITAKVYETLSSGSLSTATPLAERLPNVNEQAALMRVTYEDRSRTTLKPEDVTVTSRYTVTADNPRDLLSDEFVVSADGSPIAQNVVLPDGSPPPAGSHIEGFVVQFGPGAKEKKGQTVIGPGQIRLIVAMPNGGGESLSPIAFVSRADGATLQVNRYRFDGPDVYAASVGGAASTTMAFEFVVPPNATPTDLLVKNIRIPASSVAIARQDITPAARDALVQSGEIVGIQAESVAAPTVVGSESSGPQVVSGDQGSSREIREDPRVGVIFNKQDRGSLDLSADNKVTSGSATLDLSRIGANIPTQLRVTSFQPPDGTTIVQVDVGPAARTTILGQSLDKAESVLSPMLIDTLGQRYECVGYVYQDQSKVEIRFTPGSTIRALAELPALSRSRSDQSLMLLFTPSKGVQIRSFNLGSREKVVLDPPKQLR